MDNERKIILHKLGFNPNVRGAEYFSDIVSELMPNIENNSTAEEIKQTIETTYIEYGHFVYEVGVNKFKKELNEFHSNINKQAIDQALYHEVYHDKSNITLNNSIIAIAKYLVEQKDFIEVPKVLVK